MKQLVLAFAFVVGTLIAGGCGYHVSGHADLLPATIKTIAIPAVSNLTNRYKLSDRLASTLTREFISRSRYRIITDPNQADAILRTAVINYYSYPVVSDQKTGRANERRKVKRHPEAPDPNLKRLVRRRRARCQDRRRERSR